MLMSEAEVTEEVIEAVVEELLLDVEETDSSPSSLPPSSSSSPTLYTTLPPPPVAVSSTYPSSSSSPPPLSPAQAAAAAEEEEEEEEELRRYKLRALLLQDELTRTRLALSAATTAASKSERQRSLLSSSLSLAEHTTVQREQQLKIEREGYDKVIETITSECARLQNVINEKEIALIMAEGAVRKWKHRYRADVKKLNEEVLELDEVLYGMEKEQEGREAVWAATEMKYRRQMGAMRRRNLELMEKVKEVRKGGREGWREGSVGW